MDNGTTWTQIWKEWTSLVFTEGTGSVFLTTRSGLSRSRDAGVSWQHVLNSQPYTSFAISPTGVLFLTSGDGQFFRSNDDGATWVKLRDFNRSIDHIAIDTRQHFYLSFPASGPRTAQQQIKRSTDGGRTWKTIFDKGARTHPHSGYWTNRIVNAFVVDTEDRLFVGMARGGLFRSRDGGETWEVVNTGLKNTRVPVLLARTSAVWAGTQHSGLFRSTDRGRTWTRVGFLGQGITSIVSGAQEQDLWLGTAYDGVYRSHDGGTTWAFVGNGLPQTRDGHLFYDKPTGIVLVAYPGADLHLSTDDGATFTPMGIPHPCVETVAFNAEGHIFAGVWKYGLYRTMDRGVTWEAINNGFPEHATIRALLIDEEGRLWAGVNDTVYRSTDNGETWDRVFSATGRISDLTLSDEGTLWASLDSWVNDTGGVYRSTDDGSTWQHLDEGFIHQDHVLTLAILPETGDLLAGTATGGVYRNSRPAAVATELPEHAVAPTLSNYPNPFRTATTITFALSEATSARLVIYDVLGREVALLFDGRLPKGPHQVAFDGDHLPAGTYFLRLETAYRQQTRHLLRVN